VAEAITAAPIVVRGERGPSLAGRVLGFFVTMAKRKPLGFIALVIVLAMIVVASMPAVFATHTPEEPAGEQYQRYCLGPADSWLCPTVREVDTLLPGGGRVVPGSLSEPFGTDRLGRDIYSRMVYGTRTAMYVGLGAVLLSSLIALSIGVTSAYFGGWYDALVQRVVDAIMALPVLVVLLALPMMIGGATFPKLIVILGILGGAGGSRVIRSAVIGIRNAQYVEAATVLGATHLRIMVRHLVPNIFGPLMVQATIGLGGIILAESALSFLGFGVTDPRQPSWGQMLDLGRQVSTTQPMQAVYPGIGIALAVFSFNMLGDALRDMLDPRLRGARGGFS